MHGKKLTTSMKDKFYPFLIKRDGDVCLYDKEPFANTIPGLKRTFDHLNDNEFDNRIENLAFAHEECNQRKKTSYDMKVIASEKRKQNERLANFESLSEREREKNKYTHAAEDTYDLTEGRMNAIINKIVSSTLERYFPDNSTNVMSYSEILNGITYLVVTETNGRGSECSVRRSIDAHCSMFSPWESYREGKRNRVIRRRPNI